MQNAKCVWKRPEEFCDNPQFSVQNDGDKYVYSANDIKQGSLGDCWLLSAIATVASHKNLMERVIVTKQNNPEGYYIIRLFHSGHWVNIVVSAGACGYVWIRVARMIRMIRMIRNDTNDTK